MSLPFNAADIKSHLVGLDNWLEAASRSKANYDDRRIETAIPQMIRRFERDTQFRINPIQVCMNDDGAFPAPTGFTKLVESPLAFYQSLGPEYLVTTLRARPVNLVQRIRVMLSPSETVVELPAEWYRWDTKAGRVWVVPSSGASVISSVTYAYSVLQFGMGSKDHLPNGLAIDYQAGLPVDWADSVEWSDLRYVLEQFCARRVLDDISHVYSPGQDSKNISADGLGLSRNYTRFQDRKAELDANIAEFKETFTAQETPVLLSTV